MSVSLAIKYRPSTWEDVTEQSAIKTILTQQLDTKTFKHAYLFCGPAGCGKTTCARIFANDINKGLGNPIELDAASNNGVDDVRNIIQQSKTQSLDSEFKIFIIDECHALSNSAWQAMLKIIEEPPAKSIFIFCTTDPQKIPKTIISRVQRYDFQRISQQGIIDRLFTIIARENLSSLHISTQDDAIEYIAKLADGGMRDAITLLDKCISYSTSVTLENAVRALSTVRYDEMFVLTFSVLEKRSNEAVELIENIYNRGTDLKQFVKMYSQFVLNINKYLLGCDEKYIDIPFTEDNVQKLRQINEDDYLTVLHLLNMLVKLDANIKYSATVKADVEAMFLLEIAGETE